MFVNHCLEDTPSLPEHLTAQVAISDSRAGERVQKYHPVGFRVEILDRFVPPVFRDASWRPQSRQAVPLTLINVSDTGSGALCTFPLSIGSVVTVAGELHSVDSCFNFTVRSSVSHCLSQEDESFRIGFVFLEEVQYWDLECAHEEGFALDLDRDWEL